MRVDRRALHGVLKELVRATDPKASLPILSHVLLQATAGVLTVTATCLERTLSCNLPAEGDIQTCLPAKMLSLLIAPEGKGDAGDVVIEDADGTCSISLEGLTSKIGAMSPDDFPEQPDRAWSLVAMGQTAAFGEALAFVLPAVSHDEGRPHLNGVQFESDRLVATDGHRLHLTPSPVPVAEPLLISLSAAQTIKRILPLGEHVILARDGGHLRIGVGPWQLTTKLVDARFPPHGKVIPDRATQTTNLTVNRELFAKALARVSRLAKNTPVHLRVNGAISIMTEDPDLGNAEVVVPVIESDHTGDDLVVGVAPGYFRDALGQQGDQFDVSFSGHTDAIRLDLPGERVAVVMPMRL